MRPRVIGIVGHIRAGKTTASKYLVDRYGYTLASNSEVLSNILEDMDLPATRENLSRIGNAIFLNIGNDAIARFRLKNLDQDHIVVDGIRYIEEVEEYRKEPSFVLLGIIASDSNRLERTVNEIKSLKDRDITTEKFGKLSLARSELEVPSIIEMADFKIVNNGPIEQLYSDINNMLSKL